MDYETIPLEVHRAITRVQQAVGSAPDFVMKEIAAHPEWATIPEPVKEGLTLLHIAAAAGSVPLCAFLVAKGVDVNVETDGAGNATPLQLAARNGHVAACGWLLEHGARVDSSERSATTPLMVSAQEGRVDVVRLLLEQGADVNRIHRNMPWTALDWAENYGQTGAAAILRGAGAVRAQASDTDWSKVYGGSIISHFHEFAGPVLPISFSPLVAGNRPIELRISRIDGKDKFKLLFTVGLFAFQMIEIYVVLPAAWPVTTSRVSADPQISFPAAILLELAGRAAGGETVAEGFVVSRGDADASRLVWPVGVDALIAIDQAWPAAEAERDYGPEDEVTLLALVPFKSTKKGVPDGKALRDWIDKNRQSSWRKHSLPAPAGC